MDKSYYCYIFHGENYLHTSFACVSSRRMTEKEAFKTMKKTGLCHYSVQTQESSSASDIQNTIRKYGKDIALELALMSGRYTRQESFSFVLPAKAL